MTTKKLYEAVSVDDPEENGKLVFLLGGDWKGIGYFVDGDLGSSLGVYDRWLKELPEGYYLTKEQVKDIFDAGYDYRTSLLPEIIEEFGENSKPDFDEFINSLNIKP